jgi:hypothetical protein
MEESMSVSKVPTTNDLIHLLKFPFSDKHWIPKLLLGILLGAVSLIIPFIPIVFLTGYYYRISRRIIAEDGEAALPEWEDWGKLFTDGIKYLGVILIYSLPLIFSLIIMYLIMFLPMLSSTNASADWGGYGADSQMMSTILTMLLMYPMMSLMMLINLATGVFIPPALMHMIAKNSFGAAFNISAWWKTFRTNIGGFLISYLIMISLVAMLYFGYYILMLSIVLCCLAPIFLLATTTYSGLVTSGLYARAYRTGMENLNGKSGSSAVSVIKHPVEPHKVKPVSTQRKKPSTQR